MLCEFFLGDVEQIDDAACVAILQNDPQVVVLKVGPVVFYDMLVIAEAQDLYFLFNGIDLGQAACRQNFDCVEISCSFMEGLAD